MYPNNTMIAILRWIVAICFVLALVTGILLSTNRWTHIYYGQFLEFGGKKDIIMGHKCFKAKIRVSGAHNIESKFIVKSITFQGKTLEISHLNETTLRELFPDLSTREDRIWITYEDGPKRRAILMITMEEDRVDQISIETPWKETLWADIVFEDHRKITLPINFEDLVTELGEPTRMDSYWGT